jgi:succinoglycan biosynthesis protein ExoA
LGRISEILLRAGIEPAPSPVPVNAAETPTIDVVIPALNEQNYIFRCLDSVFAQDFPADLVRVWVVDAGSTDDTARLVESRAAEEPRLTLIRGGRRLWAAEALNLGIERSSAELVARVDGHSYLEPDYLSQSVALFVAGGPKVACVGGRPNQVGETPFGRAVALARGSRFGVGGSDYASDEDRVVVDTVQCGVYRRAQLDEVGPFDPNLPYVEDEELNWRLRQAGYDILLDNRLRFHYVTRPSWQATYRQYRNYGEGRVKVVAKHPDYLKPYHLVPAGFVATMAALVALTPFSRPARRALAALASTYSFAAVAAAIAAVVRSPRSERDLVPRVAAIFVALHVGYGVGMLRQSRARALALARRLLGG